MTVIITRMMIMLLRMIMMKESIEHLQGNVLVGFEDAVMFLPVKMIVVMFFEILVVVLLCFFANTLDRPDGPVPCKEDNQKQHHFCKWFGSSRWANLLQRG